MKKAQAKVVKCAKNKSWVPRNPPLVTYVLRLQESIQILDKTPARICGFDKYVSQSLKLQKYTGILATLLVRIFVILRFLSKF